METRIMRRSQVVLLLTLAICLVLHIISIDSPIGVTFVALRLQFHYEGICRNHGS